MKKIKASSFKDERQFKLASYLNLNGGSIEDQANLENHKRKSVEPRLYGEKPKERDSFGVPVELIKSLVFSKTPDYGFDPSVEIVDCGCRTHTPNVLANDFGIFYTGQLIGIKDPHSRELKRYRSYGKITANDLAQLIYAHNVPYVFQIGKSGEGMVDLGINIAEIPKKFTEVFATSNFSILDFIDTFPNTNRRNELLPGGRLEELFWRLNKKYTTEDLHAATEKTYILISHLRRALINSREDWFIIQRNGGKK